MTDTQGNASTAPINQGPAERAISIALGGALLWRALGGAVLGPIVLGAAGAALVWRGMSGFCAVKEGLQSDRADAPGGESPERKAARRRPRNATTDAVQRTSEDSFPASDPPSWTPTNGPSRRL